MWQGAAFSSDALLVYDAQLGDRLAFVFHDLLSL